MGLGDRHGENVLMDTRTGEALHVDFDCLFDKALQLARPEVVPYRLTPSLVDAMGVTGCEETFKKTMAVTLSLLRDHEDTLLSVLEPFLRDPTVSWAREGRAQRNPGVVGSTSANRGQVTGFQDNENKDALAALQTISERLSGVYNLAHPHSQRIREACWRRRDPGPTAGMGAGEEDAVPLSVQGQTRRLVDEATSEANLAQMYIGEWARH